MYETKLITADGCGLRVLHSSRKRASRHVVVVLPFGMRIEVAGACCEQLAKRFNVVAWEGRSLCDELDMAREDALTPQAHINDLRALVELFGITRAEIVGFCSGAGIALLGASSGVDFIDRMVLVCGEFMVGPGLCPQSGFQREVDFLLPLAAESLEQATALCEKLTASRQSGRCRTEFDDAVSLPFLSASRLHRHGLNYLGYRRLDFLEIARRVPNQVRMISTIDDQQVCPCSSAMIAARLCNAERHIVLPGDHYEILRENTSVNSAIQEFLTSGAN